MVFQIRATTHIVGSSFQEVFSDKGIPLENNLPTTEWISKNKNRFNISILIRPSSRNFADSGKPFHYIVTVEVGVADKPAQSFTAQLRQDSSTVRELAKYLKSDEIISLNL